MTEYFFSNTLVIILLVGFGIQELIWIITDPRSKAQFLRERLQRKIIIIGIIFILLQVYSSSFFPFSIGNFNTTITIFGVILYALGTLIAVWAKLFMRSNWGWPGQHDIKRQGSLVTTGPFAFSRNPIYLGLFLESLGFALAVRSIFFFISFLTLVYYYKISLKEEKLLEKYFGKKYLIYKATVPRFI